MHERTGVVVGEGELVFQIGEDRVCLRSIDIALLKDGEVGLKTTTWTHMLQGIQDLTVGAILLQNIKKKLFIWFSCFILHNIVKASGLHFSFYFIVITGNKLIELEQTKSLLYMDQLLFTHCVNVQYFLGKYTNSQWTHT